MPRNLGTCVGRPGRGYRQHVVVLLGAFGPAAFAGAAAWLAARRWPRLDLAAPQVDAATPTVATAVQRHPRLRSLLQRQINPAEATGVLLLAMVIGLVALCGAAGLLLVMAEANVGLARWDLSLARWGSDHATSGSARVLRDISMLGGTAGVVGVAVAAAAHQMRRDRRWAVVAFLVLVVAGQFAVSNLIKALVDRPRPAISQLTGFSGSSFPSGHAAAAAATYGAVALLVGRGRGRGVRNALAALAVAIGVLVATTRVLLGVHWFTDVLAGLAVGWAWLAVCSIAFGGRLLRFGAPVAAVEEVAAEDEGAQPAAAPVRGRSPS